ncbi:MAG TPA: hypothetical protein VIP08_06495 [Phenylobacterium sp.]|uniref:hypothetical protein n=1 Tax=Phenylobacterium sp. TaxID=1871053 RepID=UPI002F91C235
MSSNRGADNRRAVVRTSAFEILKALRSFSRLHGGDMFALLVFTTIWSANSAHLIGDDRYKGIYDVAPDSTNVPITDGELYRAVGAPPEVIAGYVEAFVKEGIVERVPGGLISPRPVFLTAEMMDATYEFYDRILGLVSALRAAGFSFGDEPMPAHWRGPPRP